MGKKLISFLTSTRLTGILFIVFSLAMGIGTFVEYIMQNGLGLLC